MAYKTGSRDQYMMLPPSVEDFVTSEDPVRAYDAMIDAIDLNALGLKIDSNKLGSSSYDPVAMLKLLIYGYSYGWRSSRKLERACHHNLSFIWLIGSLKPDHKTIANFRKNNKKVLQNVLKQIVRICLNIGLIEGNSLFVDGTKLRGSASNNSIISRSKLEEELTSIDDKISVLLTECDEVDNKESGSFVALDKELRDIKKLKSKLSFLLEEMEKEKLSKINKTDPDTRRMKGRQGTHPGYNGQVVTDEKHGLIVNSDIVNNGNDLNQFSSQIKNANDNLGKDCKTATADAGYSNVDNIIELTNKGVDVIVPSQKLATHTPKDEPFSKDKFKFDKKSNQYICPEGKVLKYSKFKKEKNHYIYRIKSTTDCLDCSHFGICTKSKHGRSISRLKNEELKEKLAERYLSEEGQEIYAKRKMLAELPFGHIKRNLNGGYFLIRGLEAVKAEFSILTSCFNITRMITLLGGVSSMINKLKFQ